MSNYEYAKHLIDELEARLLGLLPERYKLSRVNRPYGGKETFAITLSVIDQDTMNTPNENNLVLSINVQDRSHHLVAENNDKNSLFFMANISFETYTDFGETAGLEEVIFPKNTLFNAETKVMLEDFIKEAEATIGQFIGAGT